MEYFTRIKKIDVKRAAKELIKFLDERNIHSTDDLEKLIEERFRLKEVPFDSNGVEIGLRPSNDGTFSYSVRLFT